MDSFKELVQKLQDTPSLEYNSPLWSDITFFIEDCSLPPLSKPLDECGDRFFDEFRSFLDIISKKLSTLVEILGLLNGKIIKDSMCPTFIASIVLLLCELKDGTLWTKKDGYSDFHGEIKSLFTESFDIDLHKEFHKDIYKSNLADEVFVTSMEKLHQKLTKTMWKRQIGALHCYRYMVNEWTRIHKIKCPYPLIFPGIFLQLDDYEENNKVHGMKCCYSVLKYVDKFSCEQNGYESVIYESLVKFVRYPELSIVTESLQCLTVLLPMMSDNKLSGRWSNFDDVFELLLDGLALESNKEKQKIYWKYLIELINMNANSAIRWKKKILLLITDSLELTLSTTKFVDEDTTDQMKCLESWLRVGWPTWNYENDKILIILMFKMLYHRRTYYESQLEVRCVLLMLALCDTNQKKLLLNGEHARISSFSKQFQHIWKLINNKVN